MKRGYSPMLLPALLALVALAVAVMVVSLCKAGAAADKLFQQLETEKEV